MHNKKIQYIISAVIFIVLGIAYFVYQNQDKGSDGDYFQMADERFVQEETTAALTDVLHGESALKDGKMIYVYVCGHVENAGVYTFAEGSRRFMAVDAAGGVTKDGTTEFLELAGVLSDGERIYVPSIEEAEEQEFLAAGTGSVTNGLVNINKASKEQLMSLPGIGESRAEQIIQYRETNGPFQDIGDIMKISGIKEAAFAKIKEYICV